MLLIYVAGPFSSKATRLEGELDGDFARRQRAETEEHIKRAVALAIEVAKLGFYPVTPHANTAAPEFEKIQSYRFWIDGTLELMRRACDALILVPGWETSSGATKERADMLLRGKPVFETLEELAKLLHPRNQELVPLCPRCRSKRLDTGVRAEPGTGKLRKRCCCDQCGHQFWRSEGIAEAQK
jgi:hypothetical protein